MTRATAVAGAAAGSGGATANVAVRETTPSGPCTESATETRCDAADAGSANAISPLRRVRLPATSTRPSSDVAEYSAKPSPPAAYGKRTCVPATARAGAESIGSRGSASADQPAARGDGTERDERRAGFPRPDARRAAAAPARRRARARRASGSRGTSTGTSPRGATTASRAEPIEPGATATPPRSVISPLRCTPNSRPVTSASVDARRTAYQLAPLRRSTRSTRTSAATPPAANCTTLPSARARLPRS